MPFKPTILGEMPPHPSAGQYVETYQGQHIYGRLDCLACPALGLWGYRMPAALRRAILRASGVPIAGNVSPYQIAGPTIRVM